MKTTKSILSSFILSLFILPVSAETTVSLVGEGVEKITVSVDVAGSQAFAQSLKKNLDLSGAFRIATDGSIKVTGSTGGAVNVAGRGKTLTLPSKAADDKAARMEARRLADKMCEVYASQKGFASDPICFVSRKGKDVSELCSCYPDGYDIRQLTTDGKNAVGPRWKDKSTIFFTGIRDGGPQIYELDTHSNALSKKYAFRGLATGATVSPDGAKVAIILSIHGNPELYVIDMASGRWQRMTNTPYASEGQPCWSPDGSSIVYVSDASRRTQLYIVDVATKKSRRLTSKGNQNIDPDWGPDGRIVYITKRDGENHVATIDPERGESSVELVASGGVWEHPSWARDARHIVATRDKALFVVDAFPREKGGDSPKRIFNNAGKWITPSWSRQ